MLAAVKKGRPVNEAEIPPPVASGAPRAAAPPEPAAPARPAPPLPSPSDSTGSDPQEATTPPAAAPVVVPKIVTPTSDEEQSSCATSPHLSRETEESAPPLHSGRTDGQFLLQVTSRLRPSSALTVRCLCLHRDQDDAVGATARIQDGSSDGQEAGRPGSGQGFLQDRKGERLHLQWSGKMCRVGGEVGGV